MDLRKRNILPAPRGTWDAELVAPLMEVSRAEDFFIVKHRMSMFYATTLEAVLRMRDISHLIVSGVSTNVCVESTIRDAYFRDYDVTVVEDCVAGSFPALHQATLENVRVYFGEVVSLADFFASHGIPEAATVASGSKA